ncbi:MAG: alpha/beta fold hydrolase [Deltaproteobacteria bacterium]|nr:alpha/beta fold hydrolase [Deltaproteobacteria bacterium]
MPRIRCNDVALRVEEVGSGSPLLLIMGLGASLETWIAQRDAFARHHRVIMFDNRGAGESDCPPPPWTVPDMAADAVGVLDALGIERAHVLGVSMGGMIAQELAIGWPERVDRMVVALSFARPDPVRRAFLLFRRWARLQGVDLVQEGVANLPWLVSARVLNDPDRLEAILEVVATMPLMAADAYGRQIEAILDHDTLSRLDRVRTPTLVLAAAEDVLTPLYLSREIAGAIAGARLVVLPRGNHGVQIEEPAAFNTAVLEFLAER